MMPSVRSRWCVLSCIISCIRKSFHVGKGHFFHGSGALNRAVVLVKGGVKVSFLTYSGGDPVRKIKGFRIQQ